MQHSDRLYAPKNQGMGPDYLVLKTGDPTGLVISGGVVKFWTKAGAWVIRASRFDNPPASPALTALPGSEERPGTVYNTREETLREGLVGTGGGR